MKKLIVIFLFILIGGASFSQSIVNRTNSSYTVQDSRFSAALNLYVPKYADTTAANLAVGLDSLSAVIFTYDVMSLWVRKYDSGKKWVQVGSGGGGGSGTVTNIATGLGLSGGPITTTGTILVDTANVSIISRQRAAATYQPIGSYVTGNIYTTDGTLSGNRIVDANGNYIRFTQASQFLVTDNVGATTRLSIDASTSSLFSPSGTGGVIAYDDGVELTGTEVIIDDLIGSGSGFVAVNNSGVLSFGTFGTGVQTALGVNVGSAGAFITFNGNAGTPSAIVLTNATGTASSLNIGGTAPAGSLTGTTLNATVVTSSLTSVGTLTSGTASIGFVVGGVTMTLGSDASFDMYYRNGSGVLTRLANGTDNQVLTAHTGAAPTWEASAGGSSLFPTTGTGTATGDIIGDLNGHSVEVKQGISQLFNISPASFVTQMAATNDFDESYLVMKSDSSINEIYFELAATDNVNPVIIVGDVASQTLSYTSGKHHFTGNTAVGGAPTALFQVINSGVNWLSIDPANGANSIQAFNATGNGNNSTISTDATSTTAEMSFVSNFNDGVKIAHIDIFADATQSYLEFNADTHTFTGAVTLNNAITLAAGTATAGTAPLYFTSGTDLTVPVSGAMEFDGVRFFTTTASGRGLSASEMFARVNSDFTLANSNADQTLFPSNQNLWTLQGSTTYKVKFALRFTTGSTSHTYALGFTLAGGASITSMLIYCGSWVTAINATSTARTNTAVDQVASTVVTAASTTSAFIEGEGYIVMNAGGTVEPIIKFSADPTGTCLLKANSYITFTPIGSNTVENVGNVQ